MIGENWVKLRGYIKSPELKTVGPYDSSLFKAKLAIPVNKEETEFQYLHVASFECADALSQVSRDKQISIHGHIEDNAFTSRCRHCGGYDKRFWYEIIIDAFEIMGE